jgi:hypothetical protein
MRILLFTFIAFGFTFVVVLGVMSVVADLLALSRHRPPSIFDAFSEEDPDSDDQESEDRNRPAISPYLLDAQSPYVLDAQSPYVLDAQATRAVVTDINADRPEATVRAKVIVRAMP